MRKIPFTGYNFEDLLRSLFNCTNLQMLHELDTEKHEKLFEVGSDSSTIFHKKFYDRYREGWHSFEGMYESFVGRIISPMYKEDFLYQKFPTIRFALPNNVAVGAFHTDAEFNHPDGEMNYIIPLTDAKDTATIYLESEPGKEDFTAIEMKVGELIEFNGNKLRHGNKVNETGMTRVSMDFRVLPLSKYRENESAGGSMTLNTKFVEGQYYKRFIQQ